MEINLKNQYQKIIVTGNISWDNLTFSIDLAKSGVGDGRDG
jgi:hypothetical protein